MTPGKKNTMATRMKDLKPYTCCWLHTNAGDHYAGHVMSAELNDESCLDVTIGPMVRITPSDADIKWRVLERRESYAFSFEECAPSDNGSMECVQFKSSVGDVIVLTSKGIDELIIGTIINESS